ncbi:MAG TPA: type II CRISPR-associated endonuclease Cas1, partial [Pirellulales bacterium]|nr:type II CRISPR-associated endonuclease Cas1 [Pirellulales bacterium]
MITPDGGGECSVPLTEIAVLIAAHPQVTFTQAVLGGLAAAGGIFIVCDERWLPAGMLLPLRGHHLQARRFQAQAAVAAPVKKRLWQQIVRAKIETQAQALETLHGDSAGLRPLVPLVRSGDPENIEARAARIYWPLLFADESFRRQWEAGDQNRLLNYGYAVLRAIVARALCAAGLHPTLGLHHHNQYSAFCLADDLMEPFRPVVDIVVARL